MVSSVVTDGVIAIILSWFLCTRRTGYPKTDHRINRIIRNTMQTGLVVTIWATTDLVLFLTMPYNSMHLIPQLSLCKLYTASLLTTLNTRNTIREPSTEDCSEAVHAWRGTGNAVKDQIRTSLSPTPQTPKDAKVGLSLEHPIDAIQIVSASRGYRNDAYELDELRDGKRLDSGDVEARIQPSPLS
ncbi:unnamed protein product [Rhizoctonia solani]|uniref:DUF6534 domain-containing protein n=1 Tax=Rhizoctonia solani TaxID=456999 RepID=A0A8H2W7M3_9AGAM|nr:unnamed protein product [Rhizoctonia solani]